ncbi:MAG: NACHT domain-containing protein [Snowella sp.]|nr:NACHT domain-containing protein [Snowella sp.]
MNIPIETDEINQLFLQEIAQEVKLQGEYKKVFLERFAKNNRGETNTVLGKKMWPDHNYDQKFTVSLKNAIDQIKETYKEIDDLIPEKSTASKGRRKKGESEWEIIYDWLWNKKYQDFCQNQVSSQLSMQEVAITLDLSIFKNMLDEQRRKLTSNSLASKNGFRSNRNFDDVYVPLGLVKPKDEPKREFKNVEDDPRLGSRFYNFADYEIAEEFSNTEFFEKVLSQEKAHRLAIVGEPGAGKTTLLQKISTWIEKEKNDAQIIWVSLAKLKNKSLKDYLLDEWLKNAKDVSETTKAEKDALIQIFKAGNVWLLLDGVDEMGINNPLFNLHEQIEECWLKHAKIILSCRLNVWEIGINHLYEFEAYRNLDFSEPERDQFIRNWFEENSTLADQLITELDQDRKERIRDLVKNPLRLTMVCFSWHKNKGKLPDTKAGLYKECVDAFYDWKAKEAFPTTPTERRELNQALGELAKNALEQDLAWFRITHQQVCQYLSDPNEEGLGKKAIKLGWLNQVGVSEQNSDDEIYAFFHPSFQEYFAACAIENWDFFLPNDHVDQPVDGKVYRIFKPQWKQVFLLWLGRSDIDESDKESFIQALVVFSHVLRRLNIDKLDKETLIQFLIIFNHSSVDQCDRFYHCRAFYIAAEGIAEFKDCSLADIIINIIIQWGFNPECEEAIDTDTPIAESARGILLETNTQKAITALIELIKSSQDNTNLIEYLLPSLEEIALKNKQVISALTELLQCCQNESVIYIIVESLGRIGQGNFLVITALIELIQSFKNFDFDTIEEIAYNLGKIAKGNNHVITALIEFLQDSQDESVIYVIVDSLGEIVQNSLQAERIINSLYEFLKDKLVFRNALDVFLKGYCKTIIEEKLTVAITELNFLIRFSESFSFDIIDQILHAFDEIENSNLYAITTLINRLKSSIGIINTAEISRAIEKTEGGIDQATIEINSLRKSLKNELIFKNVVDSFFNSYCSKIRKEALKGIEFPSNNLTNSQIVRHSKEDNEKKIMSLIELIQCSQDKATIFRAVTDLGKIEQGNEQAITALVSLIQSSFCGGTSFRNTEASLKAILVKEQMPRVITKLKDYLSEKDYTNYSDYCRYKTCYSVLWKCAQTLSYPEFYKAWHSQPEIIHPEILEISPLGTTNITQTLNQQILDLPSQLKPTETTYPLLINAQSLEDETDNSSIAQELCNQIYQTAFPDEINIPEINNAPQLKRLIPNIKKQLGTKNLALIFHNGEPNESLIKFCKKLADVVHIKWITNQPIENGIPPQENLVNILQNWINELG